MSSMVTIGYKSVDATNLKGGYWDSSVVTIPILDHRDGHYVKSNMVAFMYPNFKKDVDLDAHVRMFNSTIKVNVKTSK